MNTRNWSDRHNMERHMTAVAERDAAEAAAASQEHERQRANAAAEARAEAELSTTSRFDWMSLSSLDEHPLVVRATADCEAAQARLVIARDALTHAQADLGSLEESAARGRRDDAAMRKTRALLETHESELRIAEAAVRLTDEQRTDVYRAIAFAASANLRVLHEQSVLAMDEALREARVHSRRAAELEDKSAVLFRNGPYTARAKRLARQLRPTAWRKEFGDGGYYDFWRRRTKHIAFPD